MRAILTALILGIAVAAAASPALANRDLPAQFADPAHGTPQVNVSVVAGSDEQGPAMQEPLEKN